MPWTQDSYGFLEIKGNLEAELMEKQIWDCKYNQNTTTAT